MRLGPSLSCDGQCSRKGQGNIREQLREQIRRDANVDKLQIMVQVSLRIEVGGFVVLLK